MVHRPSSAVMVVLVVVSLAQVYSGCSGAPAGPTSVDRVGGSAAAAAPTGPVTILSQAAALLAEQGYGCTVEITGPSKLCVDCDEKKNQAIILSASGSPGGGTYKWTADPPGSVELSQGKDFKERVAVTGVTASTAKNDITITVTYTAPGVTEPCVDTHPLTAVRPNSLEVVSDSHFTVRAGVIQPAPGALGKYMPPTKKTDTGSILIRFYKVLDQFGELWECDGELTEELDPSDKIEKGGNSVHNGIPKTPDRLFRIGDPNDKKDPVTFPFVVTQKIKVSGCLVRTNTITYTEARVVMAP